MLLPMDLRFAPPLNSLFSSPAPLTFLPPFFFLLSSGGASTGLSPVESPKSFHFRCIFFNKFFLCFVWFDFESGLIILDSPSRSKMFSCNFGIVFPSLVCGYDFLSFIVSASFDLWMEVYMELQSWSIAQTGFEEAGEVKGICKYIIFNKLLNYLFTMIDNCFYFMFVRLDYLCRCRMAFIL